VNTSQSPFGWRACVQLVVSLEKRNGLSSDLPMTNDLHSNCRVCGDRKVRYYYTSQRVGVSVYKCLACGSTYVGDQFTDNELQAVYENSASFYDLELSWEYGGHERRLQEIARFFPLSTGKKPHLLDVGCGTGKFLALAAQKGYEVYGTELAELPIRLAKIRYGLDISQTNLSDDKRDGFYDVITMWGLLEHVQAPGKLISEVVRLLSSGGVVGILTPVSGLYDKLAYLVYRFSARRITNLLDHRNNRAHLSILSERALMKLAESQRLKILLAQRVTELGLPIEYYLRNIGIRNAFVVYVLAAGVRFSGLLSLFFRNNILIYAQKPA